MHLSPNSRTSTVTASPALNLTTPGFQINHVGNQAGRTYQPIPPLPVQRMTKGTRPPHDQIANFQSKQISPLAFESINPSRSLDIEEPRPSSLVSLPATMKRKREGTSQVNNPHIASCVNIFRKILSIIQNEYKEFYLSKQATNEIENLLSDKKFEDLKKSQLEVEFSSLPNKPSQYYQTKERIINQDFESLVNDRDTGDVIFDLGVERFYAHRALLSLHGDYFDSMLYGNFLEGQTGKPGIPVIHFQDCDPKIFHTFLIYAYSGNLMVEDESMFFDIYQLVQRIMADKVQNLCISHLKKIITKQNAFDYLTKIYERNLDGTRLAEEVMQTVLSYSKEIIGSLSFNQSNLIPLTLLKDLLKSDYLLVEEDPSQNEYALCLLANNWLEEEQIRQVHLHKEIEEKEEEGKEEMANEEEILTTKDQIEPFIRWHLLKETEWRHLTRQHLLLDHKRFNSVRNEEGLNSLPPPRMPRPK